MTRWARHPFPHANISVSDEVEIEAASTWQTSNDSPQPTQRAALGRDRTATSARPLRCAPNEHQAKHAEVDAGNTPETLLAVADVLEQPSAPPVSERQSWQWPSRQTRHKAIRAARPLLLALMVYYILSSGVQLVGGPAFPLAPFPWGASSAASGDATLPPLRMDGKVVTRVRPMTQMQRVDLYDSKEQFDEWAGSACSAASLAEILTAYGLPDMTIGRMIRELEPDITPQSGLLTYSAFNKVAAKYGLRADVYLENNPLTYKQMLYLTTTLGIPVTINLHATTGYYRYLSGGHILVMTGGDSKTIRLTDSSLYFMKSLPIGVYDQMARSRNVVIVPKNYHYTLPR